MDEIRWSKVQGTSPGQSPGLGRPQGEEKGEVSFGDLLRTSMEEANSLQDQAAQAMEDLAQGRTEDLHRTMVLMEKADLSFKLMMQVRNKLLEAYQELTRMPL
jgi:flagellar hook-basal body complex protein FliE